MRVWLSPPPHLLLENWGITGCHKVSHQPLLKKLLRRALWCQASRTNCPFSECRLNGTASSVCCLTDSHNKRGEADRNTIIPEKRVMSHLRCAALSTEMTRSPFFPNVGLYQRLHLPLKTDLSAATCYKLPGLTQQCKYFLKAWETWLSEIEYLLTCSVGVGFEQTLEPGSPAGCHSWWFWKKRSR